MTTLKGQENENQSLTEETRVDVRDVTVIRLGRQLEWRENGAKKGTPFEMSGTISVSGCQRGGHSQRTISRERRKISRKEGGRRAGKEIPYQGANKNPMTTISQREGGDLITPNSFLHYS